MSIKKNLDVFTKIQKENLREGKNTKLLVKGFDNNYYQVKSYTAYVRKMEFVTINKKRMCKLELVFEDGILETVAFNNDIGAGDFVTVIGYFSNFGEIKFNCKCGIERIIRNGNEIVKSFDSKKFNLAKTYSMGEVVNLSKIELLDPYIKNEDFVPIKELKDFYYIVDKEEIEDNVNKDNEFLCDEEDTEEFVDYEEISE